MSEELAGELTPPMANGEVIFEAPWQGRIFGMAKALADAGVYSWDEFRASLIREVAAWDQRGSGDYAYYDVFLQALENLLAEKDLVAPEQLRARLLALRARPHGHDH